MGDRVEGASLAVGCCNFVNVLHLFEVDGGDRNQSIQPSIHTHDIDIVSFRFLFLSLFLPVILCPGLTYPVATSLAHTLPVV